jgi:hypothetical protein
MALRLRSLLREPLFRLLLSNLAAGLAAAAVLFAGLLVLNPANLRGLILSDQSPEIALLLLLFGFLLTFGSAAMGTAIMTIGSRDTPPSGGQRARIDAEGLQTAAIPARKRRPETGSR